MTAEGCWGLGEARSRWAIFVIIFGKISILMPFGSHFAQDHILHVFIDISKDKVFEIWKPLENI